METKKQTTVEDIAKQAQVSPTQVTKVIFGQKDVPDDERQRILGVLKTVDNFKFAARKLLTEDTISVVIPGYVIEDYIGSVVRGVADVAKRQGFDFVINIQNLSQEDSLSDLLSKPGRVGVIAIVPFHYHRLLEACRQYKRPYVLVDYPGEERIDDALTVESHNYAGMTDVMEHLFSLGHRRIGFITGMLEHTSARQRRQAYLDALKRAKIPFDPQLIEEGNWMHAGGYPAAKRLLQLNPLPTAIVASNDFTAFGVLQAANEAGLVVGKDISLTGFDDIEMAASVTPPLTTVRQQGTLMGEIAADMLLKRMRGEPISQLHVQVETQLVIRQSTAPALH